MAEEERENEPVIAEVSRRVTDADGREVLVAAGTQVPPHLADAYPDGEEVPVHDPERDVPEYERRGPDDPIVEAAEVDVARLRGETPEREPDESELAVPPEAEAPVEPDVSDVAPGETVEEPAEEPQDVAPGEPDKPTRRRRR